MPVSSSSGRCAGISCSGTPADIVEAEEHDAKMKELFVAETDTLRAAEAVDVQADPEPAAEPALTHGKARL